MAESSTNKLCFTRLQSERLRYALRQQRRQETETILMKMETKALVLMAQTEEEMSRALSKNKNMELENLLRRMETENQTWQRMARENEAMVATLNSTLEQVRERAANTTSLWHVTSFRTYL